MRPEAKRSGDFFASAKDWNDAIDQLNSLRITVGEGLVLMESAGGIHIALEPSLLKRLLSGTS